MCRIKTSVLSLFLGGTQVWGTDMKRSKDGSEQDPPAMDVASVYCVFDSLKICSSQNSISQISEQVHARIDLPAVVSI